MHAATIMHPINYLLLSLSASFMLLNGRGIQCSDHRCPCFAHLVSNVFHLTFGCVLLTISLFSTAASQTKPDNLHLWVSLLIPYRLSSSTSVRLCTNSHSLMSCLLAFSYKRLEVLAVFTNVENFQAFILMDTCGYSCTCG